MITITQTDENGLAFRLQIESISLDLNPGQAMAIAQAIEAVVSGEKAEIKLEIA